MGNINEMAKDLAIETRNQGEKLEKLDDNMAVADKNAEDALGELKQAASHQKKAGKCTRYLICFLFLIIIGVGAIIYFNFIKWNTMYKSN